MTEGSPRILVIRRDNIGDLVCTTPLIAALRAKFPEAFLAALVNSYNRDALSGNPRLDAVFAYTKAKHREAGESLLGAYFNRIRVFFALRRLHFDYAILATPHYQPHALRFARAAGVAKVIGFTDSEGQHGIDIPVPYGDGGTLHEAEDVFRLGAPLGISGVTPSLEVFADAGALERVSPASAGRRNALPQPCVTCMHGMQRALCCYGRRARSAIRNIRATTRRPPR